MSALNSSFIENMRLKRNITSVRLYQNPESILKNFPFSRKESSGPKVGPFMNSPPNSNRNSPKKRNSPENSGRSALSLPFARISQSLVSNEIDELSRLKNLLRSELLNVCSLISKRK